MAPLPGQKMPRASINRLLDFEKGRPARWKSNIYTWYKRKMREGRNGDYCYELARFLKLAWMEWGLDTDPMDVNEDMILDYLNSIKSDRNRDNTRIALQGFLSFNGNYVMTKLPKPRRPRKKQRNVRWLSDEEVYTLLTCDLDPREALVVHMGLILGMRKCGMVTLQMNMYNPPFLKIFEKGYYRDVKFQRSKNIPRRDTQTVIDEWFAHREKMLKGKESDSFFVGPRSPYLSDTMAVKLNKRIREKVGFHFTFHDLRRTWGRTAWKSGVDIETISEMMGHENTMITRRYLGINIDDMDEALDQISDYQESKLFNFQNSIENRKNK